MAQSNPQLRNLTFNETFDSSLPQQNNQKFSIDKILIQGLKSNDVSKIIDQNELGGKLQIIEGQSFASELTALINNTRKLYDEKKSESVKVQQQIQKLKQEKQQLQNEENKYNEILHNIKKQYHQTSNNLQQIISQVDEIVFRKDIYSNAKDSSKHDLLILKKRYFDMDIKLVRNSAKLRTIRAEHQAKTKLSKRYRELLDSVQKTVNVKQIESRTKINSFCDAINRRQSSLRVSEMREREIRDVMISAMTDKHTSQKQWVKVLNANVFLKGLLRAKMQKLMGIFTSIQLSFHKMKQATSIKNSNQFIERFLHREQTYGFLLSSISEKQKQLSHVKEEKQQLEKIFQENLAINQQINELIKNNIEQHNNYDNNFSGHLHQLNEQIFCIVREQQMMYQWGIKFLVAFNSHQTRDIIAEKFPKNKKKQLIIEALQTIHQFIDTLQKQQNYQKKIEESFLGNMLKDNIMSDKMLERNVRVRIGPTNSASRLDTLDKDLGHDDLSQIDYLNHSRRAIKKSQMTRKFRIKTKPN